MYNVADGKVGSSELRLCEVMGLSSAGQVLSSCQACATICASERIKSLPETVTGCAECSIRSHLRLQLDSWCKFRNNLHIAYFANVFLAGIFGEICLTSCGQDKTSQFLKPAQLFRS